MWNIMQLIFYMWHNLDTKYDKHICSMFVIDANVRRETVESYLLPLHIRHFKYTENAIQRKTSVTGVFLICCGQ